MLSEVLTSLHEVKSRLQERLLQQPEYPALLIVDKAAFQLGEVLTLLRPQPARLAENRAADAPVAATAAVDDPAQAAHARRGEDPNADAPVAMAAAADQPAGAAEPCFEPAKTVEATCALAAASSLDASEEGLKDAPADTDIVALTGQPLAGGAGAILAKSGHAPAPAPRTYLPFFIGPRLTQNNRY